MSARQGEQQYRGRWAWDDVAWGSHCVDCYPGNCSYRVYVKDGQVRHEEVGGTFAPVEAGVPDMNPMGCNKGAAWSRQLTNPDRLTHPLRRVGERGSGEFERISWDEAWSVLADSIIDAIEDGGPETVMHEGTPEMTTVVPTHRFFDRLGGTVTDFNGTTNDFNVGMHMTFGKYLVVSSIDDWFHAELLIVWHMNPAFTRIPHAHYLFEARYHGAEVVMFAPDYNASGMHTDYFVPVECGSDAALALAMSQVVIEENLVDLGFVASQTDLPLLVRTDNGRFLRQADIAAGGRDDVFCHWVEERGGLVEAPRGPLLLDYTPAVEGRFGVDLADGTTVDVEPVFARLRRQLDAEYTPEAASPHCGVNPGVIRDMARKVASKRTSLIFGAAASKYYHGDLIERSLCLLLALTGNWGKKGTGIRAWSSGMLDGQTFQMSKTVPGLDGTAPLVGLMDMAATSMIAADPTTTREVALSGLLRVQSGMVPPFFFWYDHCGYRERWEKQDWAGTAMPKPLPELVEEALGNGWWPGCEKLPVERPPRVLIECGSNMLRRTRGGRDVVLGNLWPKLDMVCVIDTRMNATAQYADLVLPAANHYEKQDFHIPTPHLMHLVFSDRAAAPVGEALTEWEVFAGLAKAIATRAEARGLESYTDANNVGRKYADLWGAYTIEGYLEDGDTRADEIIRDTAFTGALPDGTNLETLREHGHLRFTGWGALPFALWQASPFPEGETHAPLRNHVEQGDPYPTLTRRAQFYIDHPWFIDAGEALPRHRDSPKMGGDYPFMVTSGHCRWSIHRMNIANEVLLQTHRGEPHIAINPDDAASRGIGDWDPVEVTNDSGSYVVKAKLMSAVRPGQVIVYNGWERFQFPGWGGPNDVEAGMVKWLHLAGGYGHLNYSPTAWQPATVDRGTRVDIRRAPN